MFAETTRKQRRGSPLGLPRRRGSAVRKLGKEAEGLVENGTIFRHVEFSFVMAGSRSPPRKAAGCPVSWA